jgi:hypothetical protein
VDKLRVRNTYTAGIGNHSSFFVFLEKSLSGFPHCWIRVLVFIRPHFDSGDTLCQGIQHDAIAGLVRPAMAAHKQPRRESLLALPEHTPTGVVKSAIEMRAAGIAGLQSPNA